MTTTAKAESTIPSEGNFLKKTSVGLNKTDFVCRTSDCELGCGGKMTGGSKVLADCTEGEREARMLTLHGGDWGIWCHCNQVHAECTCVPVGLCKDC